MKIGLLRHGEVLGGACFRGRTDDPLNPTGWTQMHTAVATTQWDGVVTSPLQRCAAFAREYAELHRIPVTEISELRELDFGAWEGRTAEDIMAENPSALTDFWQDPAAHPPPGGESLADFRARVMTVWADIQTLATQRVLVVCHGGVIRVLLDELGLRPGQRLLAIEVPYGALIPINTPR